MTIEERTVWIKTLKVGDRVAAMQSPHAGMTDRRARGIVTAVNPSGMIKVKIYGATPNVFSSDGRCKVGKSWHAYYWTLDPWTPEDQAQLEKDTAEAKAAAIAHAAEEARLDALPAMPGRVAAGFVKELERELAHAREDLRKAAESVKDRADRVLRLLDRGEENTGLNRLGELQSLVSEFEGGCKAVAELEDLARAARAHFAPKGA